MLNKNIIWNLKSMILQIKIYFRSTSYINYLVSIHIFSIRQPSHGSSLGFWKGPIFIFKITYELHSFLLKIVINIKIIGYNLSKIIQSK